MELSETLSRESLEQYAQLMLQAWTEVETALDADRILVEREEALVRSVEQASAAESLARDRYRRGLDPFINVTEAQRRVLSSNGQLILRATKKAGCTSESPPGSRRRIRVDGATSRCDEYFRNEVNHESCCSSDRLRLSRPLRCDGDRHDDVELEGGRTT